MTGTYLLCDGPGQGLGELAGKAGLTAWNGVAGGVAYPRVALTAVATALRAGKPLPSVVLIDDQCQFSAAEPGERNANRTMAAFTRLLDAFGMPSARRPAFALFTFMAPHLQERLTFMEFGGHGIADRQVPDTVLPAINDARRAAVNGTVAWDPPLAEDLLITQRTSPRFWHDLFPLLPLLDDNDHTTPAAIKRHLRIENNRRMLNRYKRDLGKVLHDSVAAVDRLDQLRKVTGDARTVSAAELLGLGWIVEEDVRAARDLDWAPILGQQAVPIPRLEYRSAREPSLRERWYQHTGDPRRERGADWPPSLYRD